MIKLYKQLIILLSLAMVSLAHAAENALPNLPSWQVLEYEQKAFWATAKSRLEVLPVAGKPNEWVLDVMSSVVDNSEKLQVSFEAATGRVLSRARISSGKEQRMKSYQYNSDHILRERRNAPANSDAPASQWPITNTKYLDYPASRGDTVVTSPYMLILLAAQLQAQGPNKSMEVIVNTDLNFYRVKLTSGNGIPVDANYSVTGQDPVSGKVDTIAVAIQASPEDSLVDDDDFSVLGLDGEIILFFDPATGLPLQIRGDAPRIGGTEIKLKSVTMRAAH
ncbi:Uncharacterised protein [Halioglobus japonicus]|nr:Uncharacterised protein [Halioglobus japonicus]